MTKLDEQIAANRKRIAEARMVAERLHVGQSYDLFPYLKHLEDVVDILTEHGYDTETIIAGYLHDGPEDGKISYNDIKQGFGLDVAEIVFAVTDELGRNRKERKEKTLPKIKAYPRAIPVKIADRIANVEHGIRMQGQLVKMYIKEYPDFREALNIDNTHQKLWERLDQAIEKAKTLLSY